jgi:hypothetical protein
MVVKWLDEPEAKDFDAAADYLSLVGDPNVVEKTVVALRSAEPAYRKAKDILRAAHLEPLPTSNPHLKADLDKIRNGTRVSPILLVRGNAIQGARLQIADGYHRVCASYVTDENTPIPCRLVSWRA